MTKYREILRLASLGINQTGIANSCGCARKTVRNVLNRAKELDITWPLKADTTDADLEKILFPDKYIPSVERRYPDYDYIDKEMMRNGVTLKLLWNEYCEECRQINQLPLMYSQFCFHYQKYREKNRATMHIPRKPGEQIEVDWAGKTAKVVDPFTGDVIPCYLFVGVLNYSMYAYVEAFFSMDMESWISAHVHMYQYFGGSTRMLIPDNLRTGVDHSDWYNPKINKTYHEMAEHYNTAVIPARVRTPKDKASVEGTVGVISTWITAAIRNEKFFSLAELNKEIHHPWKILTMHLFKKEKAADTVFFSRMKNLSLPHCRLPHMNCPSGNRPLYSLIIIYLWTRCNTQFLTNISVRR